MTRRLTWLPAALAVLVLVGCGTTVDAVDVTGGPGGVTASGDDGLSARTQPPGWAAGGGPAVVGPDGVAGGAPVGGAGSGGSTGAGGATAPTGGTTAPPPGTAGGRTDGPISLGVLYSVNDGAGSAGVDNGDTVSQSNVARAYVASYNHSGGIGGRRIEPVYAELHSASNDFEAQLSAACASFTQDNYVAAVISNLGYYSENLLSCLGKAGVPLVSGDWGGPDRSNAKQFPLFISPDALLGEARAQIVVDHLKSAGFLTPSNNIGVVIEDCPINQRVYDNGLVPAVKQAGLHIVATYSPQCFRAIGDLTAVSGGMANAVVQFRQKSVDRVMFVSQAQEGTMAFFFMQAADSQHWTPGYALSSSAAPAVLHGSGAPTAQMTNAHGVGWLPALDTEQLSQEPMTATAKSCLQRIRDQGIQPKSNTDYAYVFGPCDSFGLYDALLDSTRGDATPSLVLAAMQRVAPKFVTASTVGGSERAVGGRLGAGAGRLFAFVNGAFRYTSGSFTL